MTITATKFFCSAMVFRSVMSSGRNGVTVCEYHEFSCYIDAQDDQEAARKFFARTGVHPTTIAGRDVVGRCEECKRTLFVGQLHNPDSEDETMHCSACEQAT